MKYCVCQDVCVCVCRYSMSELNFPYSTGMCVCVCVKEACTVVSHQDDINTAVQVNLLQSVHQLTHNLINLLQGVV